MKLYYEFIENIKAYENPDYDCTRFDRLLDGDIKLDESKVSLIREFYGSTNPYNRAKIVGLINNSINNISRVVKIVEDYNKIKQTRV